MRSAYRFQIAIFILTIVFTIVLPVKASEQLCDPEDFPKPKNWRNPLVFDPEGKGIDVRGFIVEKGKGFETKKRTPIHDTRVNQSKYDLAKKILIVEFIHLSPNAESNPDRVRIIRGNGDTTELKENQFKITQISTGARTTSKTVHVDFGEQEKFQQNEQIQIEIQFTIGEDEEIENQHEYKTSFYTLNYESIKYYGYHGLWAPLGIVATDFHKNSSKHYTLRPQPFNVAWGFQHLSGEKYFGYSAYATYSFATEESKNELQDGGIGLLFDVMGLFYITGSFTINSVANGPPYFLLGIGVGPKGISKSGAVLF